MTTLISALLLVAAQQAASPSTPLPETDILLYGMAATPSGVQIGIGRNITAAAGYDNQPAFSANGKSLLYSARRDGKQNEIFRFDLTTDATQRLTRSPKNEYSPRETPDGNYVTVIWEDSGTIQEIWRYPANGGRAETVLKVPELIGYYTFATPNVVFAFILGEPPTLQRVETGTLKRSTIASNVGRCIATAPDGSVSYVRMGDKQPVLHRVKVDGTGDEPLFPLLPGTEGDYAWLPDGSGVLSTQGNGLYYHGLGTGDWQLVARINEASELTRLAISPDGKMLAVVASPH